MRRQETPVDRSIVPALKAIARKSPYFTKREVLFEVLRRRGLSEAVKELRQSFPGYGFDELIMRYIDGEVGRALQAKDVRGIRLYECYTTTANGERRWRLLRAMTREDLARVVQDLRDLRSQIDAKLKVYDLFLSELGRLSPSATVDDVYNVVTRRLTMTVQSQEQAS